MMLSSHCPSVTVFRTTPTTLQRMLKMFESKAAEATHFLTLNLNPTPSPIWTTHTLFGLLFAHTYSNTHKHPRTQPAHTLTRGTGPRGNNSRLGENKTLHSVRIKSKRCKSNGQLKPQTRFLGDEMLTPNWLDKRGNTSKKTDLRRTFWKRSNEKCVCVCWEIR